MAQESRPASCLKEQSGLHGNKKKFFLFSMVSSPLGRSKSQCSAHVFKRAGCHLKRAHLVR